MFLGKTLLYTYDYPFIKMYNIFLPREAKIYWNKLTRGGQQTKILKKNSKINQHFYQSNKIHDVAFKPRMKFLRFKNP